MEMTIPTIRYQNEAGISRRGRFVYICLVEPPLFAEIFRTGIREAAALPRSLAPGECRSASGGPLCGLCHAMTLTYETEARIKADAAARFWSAVAGTVPLAPLVLSPRGRGYRTVSKRKIFRSGKTIRLGLIGTAESSNAGGIAVGRCAIEPDSHAAIYREIEERLADRSVLPLAEALRYAIIKGNYLEQSVLFNVRAAAPAVTRAVNRISHALTARFGKTIAGVFVFEGETGGRYYLAPREPGAVPRVQKVFGQSRLFVRVGGRPFLYPPLAFSQINESILEPFLSGARSLLSPAGGDTLFDLYCGYGLFGLSLAPAVERMIGAEASHLAVAAARENARRGRVTNARFVRTLLNGESLRAVTAGAGEHSLMLLDPPRSGTAPGVIEQAAARLPRRVVHVFCNPDIVPRELLRWKKAGYEVEKAIPFDMFPGTEELELMVLLRPEGWER